MTIRAALAFMFVFIVILAIALISVARMAPSA